MRDVRELPIERHEQVDEPWRLVAFGIVRRRTRLPTSTTGAKGELEHARPVDARAAADSIASQSSRCGDERVPVAAVAGQPVRATRASRQCW